MSRLRINKRLVLTLLLAVLCVAAFLAVWWYQLRQTVKESLQRPEIIETSGSSAVLNVLPIATQDAALLALHVQQVETELQQLEDSPQKSYLQALLAIVKENKEEAVDYLQAVEDGWDPLLRSRSKVLIAAYDEYDQFERENIAHLQTVLARALAEVQECPLAIQLAAKASSQLPTYRDAWLMQGFCNVTIGQYEQAIIALEKAYTLDRQKPEIQYFLARSYRAVERLEDATVYFRRAKANGFQPVDEITVALAEVAIDAGNYSAAV